MDIRTRAIGPVAVLEISGRITINERPGTLKDAVADALACGARHVLLNLDAVRYIDSTRLGEIIGAHVTVSRRGGHLRLVRTPPRIADLLAIAGLDAIFECFDSVEAAAADLT